MLYRFRLIWRWIISRSWNQCMGHSRLLEMAPFKSLGTVSYSPSIVTVADLVSLLRYGETLLENRDFSIPPCIGCPRYGGPRRNFTMPFGVDKLEWCAYLRICWAVSTEYRRVTDGQTDRLTEGQAYREDILRRHSPRYAEHRAVIIWIVSRLIRNCWALCSTE